jgi:hypothetical protein
MFILPPYTHMSRKSFTYIDFFYADLDFMAYRAL